MTFALLVLSVSLLLLAGAVELWWGIPARRERAAGLEHIDAQLGLRQSGERGAGVSSPLAADLSARTKADDGAARVWPWDGILQSAGFAPGWHTPALWIVGGIALAALAAMRIGSVWVAPVFFAVFVVAVAFWLSKRIEARQRRILAQLPEFLENMVRLTALGRSLPAAFQSATTRMSGPIRELLDDALRNARGGMDLDRALLLAARRYRLQTLEVLALVLGMCLRVGGRADQVLQRMGDFMRDVTQAQQELRATTSETRGSAWVLGLLPPLAVLFMALMSPEFFQPLIHTALGHRILIAAGVLEALGVFLLYRLARSL